MRKKVGRFPNSCLPCAVTRLEIGSTTADGTNLIPFCRRLMSALQLDDKKIVPVTLAQNHPNSLRPVKQQDDNDLTFPGMDKNAPRCGKRLAVLTCQMQQLDVLAFLDQHPCCAYNSTFVFQSCLLTVSDLWKSFSIPIPHCAGNRSRFDKSTTKFVKSCGRCLR